MHPRPNLGFCGSRLRVAQAPAPAAPVFIWVVVFEWKTVLLINLSICICTCHRLKRYSLFKGSEEYPEMGFRILTVYDEASARRQLRGLLSLDPECELIGECRDGAEAMRSLEDAEPDILYMDAETPQVNGFEVARAITGRSPLVILTSARSDYALRAFEAQVFDYLLKPIEPARFHDSLGRAKAEVARRSAISAIRQRQTPERIAVRQNGRVLVLRLDEIDWIEAADNYVGLHCGSRTHMLRETMSEAEARLDPTRFVRIHRSAIVNIDRIRELRPWFRGDYQVFLEDGTQLTLTKAHRERLDSQLLLGSFAR